MNIGPAEILVILVVALVAVGPTRLPTVARKIGGGLRDMRQLQQAVLHGLDDTVEPWRRAEIEDSEDH